MATRKKKTKTTSRKRTTKKKTSRSRANSAAELKPRTKSQLFRDIAEDTGLNKKDVQSVFESMEGLIKKDLGRRGPGAFTVPGLMKVRKVHKPRRPARKGINPFTGEETTFKAKAAHNVVKVSPLKKLKDMV